MRQAIRAGGPFPVFVNEVALRQAILRGGFLNETGQSAYAVTSAEAGAGADTPSSTAVLPSAAAESGSAADNSSLTLSLALSLAETGAGADATSSLAVLPSAQTEAGAAADAPASLAVLPSTITDAGSAADAPDALIVVPASIGETGAAVDASASLAILPSAVAETGASAETLTTVAVLVGAVAEAGSGADVSDGPRTIPQSIAESGAAGDAIGGERVIVETVTESGISALDAFVLGPSLLVGGIGEAASAAELLTTTANLFSIQAEIARAADLSLLFYDAGRSAAFVVGLVGRIVADPLAEIDFGIDATNTEAVFLADPIGDVFVAKPAVTWTGQDAKIE